MLKPERFEGLTNGACIAMTKIEAKEKSQP